MSVIVAGFVLAVFVVIDFFVIRDTPGDAGLGERPTVRQLTLDRGRGSAIGLLPRLAPSPCRAVSAGCR